MLKVTAVLQLHDEGTPRLSATVYVDGEPVAESTTIAPKAFLAAVKGLGAVVDADLLPVVKAQIDQAARALAQTVTSDEQQLVRHKATLAEWSTAITPITPITPSAPSAPTEVAADPTIAAAVEPQK